MSEQRITTGTWIVSADKEAAFVDAWADFAASASRHGGATTLRLGRDAGDPRRFVSFAAWATEDAVSVWKADPDMREALAQVLQHVDDFHNEELDVLVTASDGRSDTVTGVGGQESKGA